MIFLFLIPFLSQGQEGKVWEPSNKTVLFEGYGREMHVLIVFFYCNFLAV